MVDVLALHADRAPDAPALIDGERRLTWREFVDKRNRLASALRTLGVAKGEHVIVYLQNGLEAVLGPAAARAIGAIPVPMNHRLLAHQSADTLHPPHPPAGGGRDAVLRPAGRGGRRA